MPWALHATFVGWPNSHSPSLLRLIVSASLGMTIEIDGYRLLEEFHYCSPIYVAGRPGECVIISGHLDPSAL